MNTCSRKEICAWKSPPRNRSGASRRFTGTTSWRAVKPKSACFSAGSKSLKISSAVDGFLQMVHTVTRNMPQFTLGNLRGRFGTCEIRAPDQRPIRKAARCTTCSTIFTLGYVRGEAHGTRVSYARLEVGPIFRDLHIVGPPISNCATLVDSKSR